MSDRSCTPHDDVRSVLTELLRLYDWRFELASRERAVANDEFHKETKALLNQYGREKKAAWEAARMALSVPSENTSINAAVAETPAEPCGAGSGERSSDAAPLSNDKGSDALLPCPHCGGQASFGEVEDDHTNFGARYIDCATCGASTNLVFPCKGDVERELRERWNRRTPFSAGTAISDLIEETAECFFIHHSPGSTLQVHKRPSSFVTASERNQHTAIVRLCERLMSTPQSARTSTSDDVKNAARYRWLNSHYDMLLKLGVMDDDYTKATIALKCGEPLDRWIDERIAKEVSSDSNGVPK